MYFLESAVLTVLMMWAWCRERIVSADSQLHQSEFAPRRSNASTSTFRRLQPSFLKHLSKKQVLRRSARRPAQGLRELRHETALAEGGTGQRITSSWSPAH